MGISRAGATRRVGAMLHNAASAENYLDGGSRGARRLMKRATRNTRQGSTVGETAIDLRQRQVGARALTGAALLGGVGMMRNRNGSRGGFQSPRGSGRYA
jgi:hypothetical protein